MSAAQSVGTARARGGPLLPAAPYGCWVPRDWPAPSWGRARWKENQGQPTPRGKVLVFGVTVASRASHTRVTWGRGCSAAPCGRS